MYFLIKILSPSPVFVVRPHYCQWHLLQLVLDGAIRISNGKLLQSLGSSPVDDDDDDCRAIILKYALKWKKRKRKDPFLLPVVSSASGYAIGVFCVWIPLHCVLYFFRVSFVM